MIFAIVAAICMLVSLGLFRYGLGLKIDASPVGSFILVASATFFLTSVFMFGVSVGTVVGALVS